MFCAQVYHDMEMDFKVDNSAFARVDGRLDLGPVFTQPMLGISMNAFTEMLTHLVGSWLGPDNYDNVVHDLIKFADSNRDNKVLINLLITRSFTYLN